MDDVKDFALMTALAIVLLALFMFRNEIAEIIVPDESGDNAAPSPYEGYQSNYLSFPRKWAMPASVQPVQVKKSVTPSAASSCGCMF